MTTYRMSIVFTGIDFGDDEVFEALSGVPDTYWRSQDGYAFATAIRESDNIIGAADRVVGEIMRLVPSARPVALDEDLVSVADIAERAQVSAEAVRQWAKGGRRSDFPRPKGVVGGGRRIWAWADVNDWLSENGQVHDVESLAGPIDAFVVGLLFARLRQGQDLVGAHWATGTALESKVSKVETRAAPVSMPGAVERGIQLVTERRADDLLVA